MPQTPFSVPFCTVGHSCYQEHLRKLEFTDRAILLFPIQETKNNMEFTDRQDSPRIPPTLACYFIDTTHRANSLRFDFREAQLLHNSPFHPHSLSSPNLHTEILEKERIIREMEKERIRREVREEMLISEMARRRELMMQMGYFAPRMVDGLTFLSPSPQTMGFVVSPMRHSPAEAFETKISPLLNRELQSESRRTEVNPVSGRDPEKQKRIVLVDKQIDKNIPGTKRKAESPPAPAEGIDVVSTENGKRKVESQPAPAAEGTDVVSTGNGWYCQICRVSGIRRYPVSNHLQGRKHKSKEAALRYSFWSDICEVGAHSDDVMSSHKRGRKHMNHLGRNEAKVSVLVNNLAEWVDADSKKSSAQENHEAMD